MDKCSFVSLKFYEEKSQNSTTKPNIKENLNSLKPPNLKKSWCIKEVKSY